MSTIPFGADYDDQGNRVDAVEAYDQAHGDPGVPWPGEPNTAVGSVRSVRNAGQRAVPREPPFVRSVRTVGNSGQTHTSNTDLTGACETDPPLSSQYDTSNSSNTSLLAGARSGGWLCEQTFPPLRFSVPDIVPAGFCVLAGPPKAGKSWLALDWLLAVQAGGRALGQIPVGEPRHVLYMALEDSDRRMQERCNWLLQDGALTDHFIYLTRVVPAQVLATVEEFAETYPDAGMVVIDTLGKVMPPMAAGETTYQRDYRVGGHLQALTLKYPALSVVVAHHTRKTASDDFVDSVSGTNGLAGAADTIIVLNRSRHSNEGTLSVTGRDVEEAEYGLISDRGRWVIDGADLSDAVAAAQERKSLDNLGGTSRDILDYFAEHPQGARAKEVAEKFGKTAYTYLTRLVDAGQLAKLERGLYCLNASRP